jgi:hypothetical protein
MGQNICFELVKATFGHLLIFESFKIFHVIRNVYTNEIVTNVDDLQAYHNNRMNQAT